MVVTWAVSTGVYLKTFTPRKHHEANHVKIHIFKIWFYTYIKREWEKLHKEHDKILIICLQYPLIVQGLFCVCSVSADFITGVGRLSVSPITMFRPEFSPAGLCFAQPSLWAVSWASPSVIRRHSPFRRLEHLSCFPSKGVCLALAAAVEWNSIG